MESLKNTGYVTALFLHSKEENEPMVEVKSMSLVAGKGILNNPRYYEATTQRGKPNMRHVSMIEEEQILEHEKMLSIDKLELASVRSNVITKDINLVSLIGKLVLIGKEAVLKFTYKRTPCYKMDDVFSGLQKSMAGGRQGILAEIIVSGQINKGDQIQVIDTIQVKN